MKEKQFTGFWTCSRCKTENQYIGPDESFELGIACTYIDCEHCNYKVILVFDPLECLSCITRVSEMGCDEEKINCNLVRYSNGKKRK